MFGKTRRWHARLQAEECRRTPGRGGEGAPKNLLLWGSGLLQTSFQTDARDAHKSPATLMPQMHPLVSRLAPLMNEELSVLHREVARWVLESHTVAERNALRFFGAELGAVQRRIRRRVKPPTEE